MLHFGVITFKFPSNITLLLTSKIPIDNRNNDYVKLHLLRRQIWSEDEVLDTSVLWKISDCSFVELSDATCSRGVSCENKQNRMPFRTQPEINIFVHILLTKSNSRRFFTFWVARTPGARVKRHLVNNSKISCEINVTRIDFTAARFHYYCIAINWVTIAKK